MACKFTCIQPCCYFFIVRTHVTELEQSGNEVALRTRYIQCEARDRLEAKRRGGCTAKDFLFLLSLLSAIPHLLLCMWIRLYLYYFPQNVNLGSQDRNSAEKPTVWVKEEKSEQENPDWKLIGKIRR